MESYALITGASSGLGVEFAKLLAARGYALILTARNEAALSAQKEALAREYPVAVECIPCDLSEQGAADALWAEVTARGLAVSILVNNAGFGDFGAFAQCSAEKQQAMIAVNIAALTQLTHHALAEMTRRGCGSILNVASIAAFQPGPLMAVYYATKACVLSLTEPLAVELRGTGVTVSALCPGPTATGFEKRAELGKSGLFKNLRVARAADVAAYGIRAMEQGNVVAIHGVSNRLVVASVRFAPRALVRRCVYCIQKEKE